MPEGVFDLHEEAARLDTASTAWADLASGITTASDGVDTAARTARDAGWEGATAESYDAHRKSLVTDLDTGRRPGRVARVDAVRRGRDRCGSARVGSTRSGRRSRR